MVLPPSHRISRVLWYSGYPKSVLNFAYGPVTLFDIPFQIFQLSHTVLRWVLTLCCIATVKFGLFPFRSPLLRKSIVFFLFLRVIRCFSSPGSLHYTIYSCNDTIILLMVSSLIRISTDLCSFATPRSFSQLVTSFFGAMYQGILLYALCSLIFSLIALAIRRILLYFP